MSFLDEQHIPTAQETAIYDALTAGDNATVAQLRSDAYQADQSRPVDAPDDWLPPVQQFEVDYVYAFDHHNDDNEIPEPEREDNTTTATKTHNDDAWQRAKS
jgi:hypothetical protein